MFNLAETLADLDERQTQFHGGAGNFQRIDLDKLDKFPVLKLLWEQKKAGMSIDPEAEAQLRKLTRAG